MGKLQNQEQAIDKVKVPGNSPNYNVSPVFRLINMLQLLQVEKDTVWKIVKEVKLKFSFSNPKPKEGCENHFQSQKDL